MRLLAASLTALWAATSLLVLVGYRPGGPADLLVGVALLDPRRHLRRGAALATGARAAR